MNPYYEHAGITIYAGDVRNVLPALPDESVNCVVTSPPYWGLRDYGCEGQLGLERTPEEYVSNMVAVFREVKRVLRGDGTLWLNMGDSYQGGDRGTYTKDRAPNSVVQKSNPGADVRGCAPNRMPIPGLKPKDLCGIPWMLAFALRADGWWLRQDIIWSKPNPMPESVTDRCTKAHEYIFLLSKSERYYFDAAAIAETSVSGDLRKPYAPGQVDSRGNGHDRGGGRLRGHLPGNKTHKGQTAYESGDELMRTKSGLVDYCAKVSANPSLMDTRNKRSVWEVTTQPFPEAHFATFPEDLIKPCILAGCPAGGTVLDPFFGSGTTGLVARANGCHCIGIELNADYIEIAAKRLSQEVLQFV